MAAAIDPRTFLSMTLPFLFSNTTQILSVTISQYQLFTGMQ